MLPAIIGRNRVALGYQRFVVLLLMMRKLTKQKSAHLSTLASKEFLHGSFQRKTQGVYNRICHLSFPLWLLHDSSLISVNKCKIFALMPYTQGSFN